MGTVRKTITLTDKQDEWIKAQIARGDFTNDSEYIRDLVRRDQEQNAKFWALKQSIEEGLESGESKKTVTQIMEEVEARLKADGEALPKRSDPAESSRHESGQSQGDSDQCAEQ